MDSTKVEYRQGRRYGGGLFAVEGIERGEVIAAFDGPIYRWIKSTREIPNDSPLYARDHCIQFGRGISRDSRGIARYANHSCNPNCGIKDLFKIVAMRDIPAGEEISWDYAMAEDSDWVMTCLCKVPGCRGLISGYRGLPPERRRAYEGFISEWLLGEERPYEDAQRPVAIPTLSALLGSLPH